MKNSEPPPHHRLQKKLKKRQLEHRYRILNDIDWIESSSHVKVEGKDSLNFSSNDYLNLSNHPILKKKSGEYIKKFGTSSSSSRLITGTLKIHSEVEEELASLYQKDRALLFSTGFQANSSILPALTEKKDIIVADQLCHNSIIVGCLASKASFYRYRHNDLDHLETFLKRKTGESSESVWVVTESLFSMDGDRAPLSEIIKLVKKYGARLYVDDAHSFGVYGAKGLGFGGDFTTDIDLLVSTFGKAGGGFGAFVVSTETIIQTLINFCGGFIYSTAPPPAIVGSMKAALDLIPEMDKERNHLHMMSDFFYQKLVESSLSTAEEPSHILPVQFSTEEHVLEKSSILKNEGIIVTAIRPPTVPQNKSRLRISLTICHQKSDCLKLLELL